MEAEKLQKKLNGAILRGTKVRIEKARKRKENPAEAVVDEEPARPRKELKSAKRKRGEETIPAAEIGERSVKRGWTTPGAKVDRKKDKEKKAVVKSKYTTGKECLFKTVVPPNMAFKTGPAVNDAEHSNKGRDKSKGGKETVIHEFEKTTKFATFLRTNAMAGNTKGVAEFIEGKGWVDEDGNVVEVLKKARKSAAPEERRSRVSKAVHKKANVEESESNDSTSGEEYSISEKPESTPSMPITRKLSSTSSSGLSTDDDSESETSSSEDESEAEPLSESSEEEVETPRKASRPSSSAGLTIKIPEPTITSSHVHPLEALYKRDRKNATPKPNDTAFSFFGADGDEEAEADDQVQLPMTPFTQKEFDFRGIRSAAPTPDTAHANRKFVWPTDNDEDEVDDGEGSSQARKYSSAQSGGASKAEPLESDFQKWFWENRGEASRAWKKRRKTAAKEKRQRENRKRESRA